MSLTWGHGKMSTGSDYYGFLEHKEYIDAFWNPETWLNSEWSEEKHVAFNDLYDVGLFGWYPFRQQFDKILDERNNDHYMDRYDIEWKDVKDPRKLKLTSSASVLAGSLNFVSRNVNRLYR